MPIDETRYALGDNADDVTHMSAEEWYGHHVLYLSTERCGDVAIQMVEYGWMDQLEDDFVALRLMNRLPGLTAGEAGTIAIMASLARGAAEAIETLFRDAVECYRRDDLRGVIESLESARCAEMEMEHGDCAATDDLASKLLVQIDVHEEDW